MSALRELLNKIRDDQTAHDGGARRKLDCLTLKELRQRAAKKKIPKRSQMNKSQLIEALRKK